MTLGFALTTLCYPTLRHLINLSWKFELPHFQVLSVWVVGLMLQLRAGF
jgi:hypothetical protein